MNWNRCYRILLPNKRRQEKAFISLLVLLHFVFHYAVSTETIFEIISLLFCTNFLILTFLLLYLPSSLVIFISIPNFWGIYYYFKYYVLPPTDFIVQILFEKFRHLAYLLSFYVFVLGVVCNYLKTNNGRRLYQEIEMYLAHLRFTFRLIFITFFWFFVFAIMNYFFYSFFCCYILTSTTNYSPTSPNFIGYCEKMVKTKYPFYPCREFNRTSIDYLSGSLLKKIS
eukprot:UN30813